MLLMFTFRSVALAALASLVLAWVAPAGAAPKGAPATRFDIVLTGIAPKRVETVRAALQRAGLTADQAKQAVAKVPVVVKRGVPSAEASALKSSLAAAGAKVEVRPAVPTFGPRKPPAPSASEARYEVVLVRAGDSPIAVIKLVREVMGLGLKDAKERVDNPPQTVARDVDLATAQQLERRFVEVGAAVEVRQTSGPPPAQPPPPPADARYDVVLVHIADGKKIEVIKRLRELLGLGLREAKELADHPPQTLRTGVDLAAARDLEQRLTEAGAGIEVRLDGVAVPPGPAPAPPPPSAPVDDGLLDVWLMSAGPNYINVVKAIRETTGLGLTEAKRLVDAAPHVVREALSRDHAEMIASRLRDAGATVELR